MRTSERTAERGVSPQTLSQPSRGVQAACPSGTWGQPAVYTSLVWTSEVIPGTHGQQGCCRTTDEAAWPPATRQGLFWKQPPEEKGRSFPHCRPPPGATAVPLTGDEESLEGLTSWCAALHLRRQEHGQWAGRGGAHSGQRQDRSLSCVWVKGTWRLTPSTGHGCECCVHLCMCVAGDVCRVGQKTWL